MLTFFLFSFITSVLVVNIPVVNQKCKQKLNLSTRALFKNQKIKKGINPMFPGSMVLKLRSYLLHRTEIHSAERSVCWQKAPLQTLSLSLPAAARPSNGSLSIRSQVSDHGKRKKTTCIAGQCSIILSESIYTRSGNITKIYIQENSAA